MKIVLFANTDWHLYNFRRSLALALRDAGHDVLLISPPGAYGGRLRALGLRWKSLPVDRRSLSGRATLRHLLPNKRSLIQKNPFGIIGLRLYHAISRLW